MSENDVIAVIAVATLAWKITARAFTYQQAKRNAAEKAAAPKKETVK